MIWPFLTRWPFFTIGFWFRQVLLVEARRTCGARIRRRCRSGCAQESTVGDDAGAFGADDHAAVLGDGPFHAGARRPADRSAAAARPGVACCEPIKARLASSCSRNGISAAETETVCRGLMSTYWTSLLGTVARSPCTRASTKPLRSWPSFSTTSGGARMALHFLVGTKIFVLAVDLAVLRPRGMA